jgi:hypothetical protein
MVKKMFLMILLFLHLLFLRVKSLETQPICDSTKQLYKDMSCCGGTGEAVCVAPLRPEIAQQYCGYGTSWNAENNMCDAVPQMWCGNHTTWNSDTRRCEGILHGATLVYHGNFYIHNENGTISGDIGAIHDAFNMMGSASGQVNNVTLGSGLAPQNALPHSTIPNITMSGVTLSPVPSY